MENYDQSKNIPLEKILETRQSMAVIFELSSALIPMLELLFEVEKSSVDEQIVTDDVASKIVGPDPEKIKMFRTLNQQTFKSFRQLVESLKAVKDQIEIWKLPKVGAEKLSPGEEIFRNIINEKK